MSYLIDSHCHLHDREFFSSKEAEDFLADAHSRNVLQIICIGTTDTDSLEARDFANSHEGVFWTYGIHPEEAGKNSALKPDIIAKLKSPDSSKLVAIGEVGLDYHYEGYDRNAQIKLLEQMLDLAAKLDLPCSFHVRDAIDDFFSVVKNFPKLKPSVLHSFTDSKRHLNEALGRGFYIGVNGILVNHSAEFDWAKDLQNNLPLDRVVLETDAPFLTPEPNRGKINRPGYISDIASWLSNQLGVSQELVAEKTTNNVRQIFNLPDSRTRK